MTYNIKNADLGTKISGIAADIQRENPDIVCVQEVDCGARRSGKKDVLKVLAEELQLHYAFFPAIKLQGGTYGIGVLSRFPFENALRTPLSVRESDEGRVLASVTVTVNGKMLTILNTHLSFENAKQRQTQFAYLQSVFSKNAPGILCGDFNVESFSEFSRIQAAAVNTAEMPFETYIGGDTAFASIDNIFVSDGISIVSKKLCDTTCSDHRPLLAEIEF
ncbi:MAG: endonuclease/exonuclease/phosphatase family protein [Candidatus Fimenecus sp.]